MGMAVSCLILAVFFIVLFVYGIFKSRQIDPVTLMYFVGAILTARVFWKRSKLILASEVK
jgi:hypothetical protein